jgi:intracellular sulfur oxidation DsrE/DsrF family protein
MEIRRVVLKAAVALLVATCGMAAMAADQVKVVYHFTRGVDEAAQGLANIRNHLRADPTVKIVVVANNAGIDFLLNDAKDRNGKAFEPAVSALTASGVEFRACNNTLVARGLKENDLIPDAKVVPAGVAEVARLQAREGYAYIRP